MAAIDAMIVDCVHALLVPQERRHLRRYEYVDRPYAQVREAIGAALDATLLHRIAEAWVLRFVQDVAVFLRTEP